jgi:murein DD-endopeptidase MepM/ murein hydrolase activator NlpD
MEKGQVNSSLKNNFQFSIFNFPLFLFLFISFSLLLNFDSQAFSRIICDGTYACVLTEEKDDYSVEFYVRNRLSYDITLTIQFGRLDNFTPDVTLPFSKTIPGDQTVKLLTLNPVDSNKPTEYMFSYNVIEGNLEARHDNGYVYSLPYAAGETYMVTQGFDSKFSHTGEQKYSIDWGMPEGTPVYAARGGIVAGVKDDSTKGGNDRIFAPYANFIIIKHSDGTFGEYLHLKKHGAKVSVGQMVEPGDLIGLSGNTGWSGAPHLHFWVFKAKNGRERESFPIRFKTIKENSVILQEGNYYTAL